MILLKYPSRERPEQFKKNVERWEKSLSPKTQYHWLFTFDEDDATMRDMDMSFITNPYTVSIQKPNGKIAACNDGVRETVINFDMKDDDMIWLISDDMCPMETSLDVHISNEMEYHYPDGDGGIHINDGLQGLRLCTFTCIGVKYFNRFGYLYHPDYKSTHADDEFTIIGWALRRLLWMPDVWVKHEWVGTHSPDALHQKNHAIMSSDGKIFEDRRNRGFPSA